jgi:transposase
MGRKSKELSPDKKEVIVNLKSNGHKISEISRILSIPESTCMSVIKTYNERKSFEKARRSGRPRKMSARSEARLKRLAKENHGKVLRDIATEFNIGNGDHSVSKRTVQQYLQKKKRIYRRIVKKRIVVKEINRIKAIDMVLTEKKMDCK